MSNLIDEVPRYPLKRGSYEIEQYLIGDELKAGCWIDGDTKYGDVHCGNQNWTTYTRPVFAYLQHVATIRSNVQTEHEREVVVCEGFSRNFSKSVQFSVGFSADFGAVNVGAELSAMFSATETISSSESIKRTLKVKGEGTIMVYQVHLVYAHHLTSAGVLGGVVPYTRRADVFDKNGRLMREDLTMLSSVVCDQLVPVELEKSITPLTWKQVNQAVLFNQYEKEPGARRWTFDFSVG
ncbi:monalysin family beta-barrel pore-forming toxin [Pseudomonas alkylphenolica]|uniref:monalysin family beta-barrel pore-forming toxin n=1 Tax=Pseudomonas alkylphenolica TaxID=237609 RepID=UPI0018D77AC1|nr:monalysin family beta-barrel pore-forming toxin [Pseudomonas alkylphenolica]MBH3430830.1 monalysin family beta-barrel pore-forming toxin [Pseudomonas alkylphenolica]